MTMAEPVSLGDLTHEHFTPLIGAGFRVSYPEHSETLTLESVTAGAPLRPGSRFKRRPFSLLFRGESVTVLLEQHMHPLEHPALGRLDILLVPIGRNDDGTHQYQAVFG